MTPEIAVGVPYIALKSYIRYRKVPKADISDTDMIVERILMLISVELNVPRADILSPSRKMPEKDARHIAIHLIRKRAKWTLKQIGKMFQRDHATIINSIRTVDGWLLYNIQFQTLYTRIEQII